MGPLYWKTIYLHQEGFSLSRAAMFLVVAQTGQTKHPLSFYQNWRLPQVLVHWVQPSNWDTSGQVCLNCRFMPLAVRMARPAEIGGDTELPPAVDKGRRRSTVTREPPKNEEIGAGWSSSSPKCFFQEGTTALCLFQSLLGSPISKSFRGVGQTLNCSPIILVTAGTCWNHVVAPTMSCQWFRVRCLGQRHSSARSSLQPPPVHCKPGQAAFVTLGG